MKIKKILIWVVTIFVVLIFLGMLSEEKQTEESTKANIDNRFPNDIVKGTPENDDHPPILHSREYEDPIPLPGPVTTVGAEDSPFIPEDRDELYFTLLTDVRVPPEKQLINDQNGIWVSKRDGDGWGKPEKITLHNNVSLNGCEYVKGNKMHFCTIRAGYSDIVWFETDFIDNIWQNWHYVGDILKQKEYEVREIHIYSDELYFGSEKSGGKGKRDIWFMKKINGEWQEPENVEAVNSKEEEMQPFVTKDGNELWINRRYKGTPGVFRSKKINGEWQEPELIVSQFAGEPTIDKNGNLYFVHHYFKKGKMIEADIYIAKKK